MEREFYTSIIEKDLLRCELEFVISYFLEKGITTCGICFGWAWGMQYYSENSWPTEVINLESVLSKLREVENLNIGKFGSDDLIMSIDNIEFNFCHESDIHLKFTETTDNSDAQYFFNRWQELGYKPLESSKATQLST